MNVRFTDPAKKDYRKLEPGLQKRLIKQLGFLRENLRHPSLNAKKYPEGGEGVWQGRVDRSYRFYFLIEEDVYVVLRVIPHPK